MKVLGDTGIIGAGLLLVLFGVLARGLLRGRSALAPPAIAVTAAAISVAAYFFAHAEFDWLETYPVLSGPALGFLIVALAVRHPAPPAAAATRARRLAVAATALAVGLAIVSLAVPYLAVRYQKRASGLARAQPALAFRDLDRAADVDPLAIDALMQRGALGLEQDELVIARNSFERANDREETWLAYYGLGLVAAARGDRVAAFGHFAKARTLNRNSPNVGQTTAVILHTGDIDPAVLFQTVQDTGLFQAEKIK
jgi:tetratricopeptide (TPR) repeat protein